MKKALIAVLACLNLALLAALIGHGTQRSAVAEGVRGQPEFMMVAGRTAADSEVVYVVDAARGKMLAWKFDLTRKRLVPYSGRDLMRDFPIGAGR